MISYIFSDNFEKAKEKLEKYEWTSDIATDDNENIIGKRNKTKSKKYKTTSSESSDEERELTTYATINTKISPRSPKIVKNTLYYKSNIVKAVSAHSSSLFQSHLKEISTPVNLIQEETNIEKEFKNDNTSLYIKFIYIHTHTQNRIS